MYLLGAWVYAHACRRPTEAEEEAGVRVAVSCEPLDRALGMDLWFPVEEEAVLTSEPSLQQQGKVF